MTAPDSLCLAGRSPGGDSGVLRIRSDDALDPAHLALIAVRDWELGARRGVALQLEMGGGAGAALAALQQGACDLLVARPLATLVQPLHGCELIGCLFTAPGGILVREDRLAKLRVGELLRVASPSASVPADRMCRRILQCWAGNQGVAVAETLIAVDPLPAAGAADAVRALAEAEADAVWPAYAHSHAVIARQQGLPVRLVTPEENGLPPVSALGLFARQGRSAAEVARHGLLLQGLGEAAARLSSDPLAALDLWRGAGSGDAGDDGGFAEAIVAAAVTYLPARIDVRSRDWQAFEAVFEDA